MSAFGFFSKKKIRTFTKKPQALRKQRIEKHKHIVDSLDYQ